jgi:hypothetical protein
MKRITALSFSIALLSVSCSLSSQPPLPGIPLTGSTASPTPSTAASQTATPILLSPTPARGSALSFDGQDDYVRVEPNPSLDLQNSFTIAAWIYLDEYTGWASLVTKGDKPNLNNYAIQQSEPSDPLYRTEFGRLRFSGCVRLPTPLPESGTVLSLKTWHFVAITFDGLRVRFYTDGQPDGESDVRGPLCTNNKPLYIGVDFPLTTEYWHGAIDELRIWNAALSDQQIHDLMNGNQDPQNSALVGYWPFDEGSGTIAHDRSPYANDGQLIGDPAWIHPATP